ncbi:MAG: putative 4-hydroxybenzoate polyprenyltransferase [Verrucomicrobiales bacterium]|jgi:4-hydroxybenzoate polyprenyltransferase|nr:putative 4-hydroxybenzoate polyprenyltransferase [Verrucomicrobiales bacterium]
MTSAAAVLFNRVSNVLEFIKFSHTVFALPFALIGMWTAGRGHVSWQTVLWILCCMVCARTAAMSFNRLIDWEIDKGNPRTANRHKLINKQLGWALLLISALAFVFSAAQLNRLCLLLSPLALIIVLFYSITKRFTAFSHFFLGFALGVAPIGAWIAVSGEILNPVPLVLGASVLCWVFGFDLIYATMDVEFDRNRGLFSFPARYGVPLTMKIAQGLHVFAVGGFLAFGWLAGFSWIYFVAWLLAALALVWEHRIADANDAGAVNKAFFNINAVVSIILLAGVFLDSMLWK